MSDIFREVDEEVRKEQYQQLWGRYGNFIIGGALAVVVAVGGFEGYKYYDKQARDAASAAYGSALQSLNTGGDAQAATNALAEISDPSDKGYGLLAAFEEARLRAEAGDLEGANALWLSLHERAAEVEMRGLAGLLFAQNNLDTGNEADLISVLQPLSDPNSSYRPLALELLGLLAVREGKTEEARGYLEAVIAEARSPQALRQRAEQVLAILAE